MDYTSKDKAEILQLIVDHGVGANAYFTIHINEGSSGNAPRRADYSNDTSLQREVYCYDELQTTPDGEITTNLQYNQNAICCAFIAEATPNGDNNQRGCSPYTNSILTTASFRYYRFINCAPRCMRYTKDIASGTIIDETYDSLPLNLDECETYGGDPSYFWYHVEYKTVSKVFGLPLFENEQDATTFILACNDYIANPNEQTLQALQEALSVSENDGVVPKMSKDPSIADGYGQLLPDGNISGVGTFDDSSDTIGIDAKPNVGVTTMGFVNVYKITQNQLQTLGEKLFPHFLPAEILADPSQLTTPEVLTMMLKTLYGTLISPVGTSIYLADNLGVIDILMNGKLIDYVIDCHAIPTSISGATVEGLKVGYRQFNDLQVARATEDYVDVDCGELNIGEYFASYLDYANVSCDLFLPFIGFVPIESEYWNGGTLKVVYRFNIVDGSFQAKVLATSSKSRLTQSIIGQYGGVACVHYPITGMQYSNVVSGLVNGSINAVAKGASGDIGGVATSLANMTMLRPDNPMSNGYNASSSFLSHRTPYLVIKRPSPQFSSLYPKEKGVPLNVAMKLSSVKGFTIIEDPVLNIACSDEEYNEIVSLLKSGVIF